MISENTKDRLKILAGVKEKKEAPKDTIMLPELEMEFQSLKDYLWRVYKIKINKEK